MKTSIPAYQFLLLFIAVFFVKNGYSQTTYTVTNTALTGTGSFTEAITLANANPGADIIEFTPGLQVDASVSTPPSPSNPWMANITESVIIDGKGGALNGIQTWITPGGLINPTTACPGDEPGTIQSAYMPGFVQVGENTVDNAAIAVTIKNLSIKQFNQVARVNKNASLVFENFEAYDTWSTFECLGDVMIQAYDGASLTITNSKFLGAENWSVPDAAASIFGSAVADLTIEGSIFSDLCKRDQPTIQWDGISGSEVNIVSSRIMRSGGIRILGYSTSNIVNSIWVNNYILTPAVGDRIINQASEDMNITASSFVWNTNECDGLCQSNGYQNLFEIRGAGDINFSESAVGFNWDPTTNADELNVLGSNGGSGVFTADEYTWMQPTTQQDADALKTITSQPNLLSDLLGFNRSVTGLTADFDVEMATPAFPGELIDVIPSGNALINPIDGSTIALDVIGNPRSDANGNRDIGAIQLGLAPFLASSNTGDMLVALKWNEPLHHDGHTIIRYEVEHVEAGGATPTVENIIGSTSHTVGGLTNGTEYEFKVRAVYNNGGAEEFGPYSNVILETPYGTIDAAVVTATPGNAEVDLSWNMPDLKGNEFTAYIIQWSTAGPTLEGYQIIYDINTLSTKVDGLTIGTEYIFTVVISSIPAGLNTAGSTTATPYGPIDAPVVTATPGNAEVDLAWDLPDMKGNTFTSYIIQWGETVDFWEGSQVINDMNTLSTKVTGLTNGTNYVFSVEIAAIPLASPAATVSATPDGALGFGDSDLLDSEFSYYPNPVNDYLHINSDQHFEARMYSIDGVLLIDAKSEKVIDISNLSSGTYILQVEIKDRTYSRKILKK
ncbi:fibronectin type III domain-containing protein [Saccharicrinis aurantiacus]|uniref:fibronectin type III domain-containing protein n=1 Tax=Saccharicrinis aurantiacus TaxID=1849719 RepID=UPI0024935B8D|nr:fibronectin type III domain-containing protein [Saccharicrinis aurantiacus]